jgi:hypothetical protein
MSAGSSSVIKLISTLDKLKLIKYNNNIKTFEHLMWEFASINEPTGNILEELDAKLYPDEVYRAREKERELQKILGRIKTSN